MKDTYTYVIGENLYINLTNRCSNRCRFCVRDLSAEYEGYRLWLKNGEPTVGQIADEIGDAARYREVVFCGYGEPTYRLNELKEIAEYVHEKGGKTRLNTNGHGSVINGRNIAPELVGKLDGVNISLNAPEATAYTALCRPQIKNAFEAVADFGKAAKAAGLNAWFSVVDCIGAEAVAACRKIADGVGIPLRVRELIE